MFDIKVSVPDGPALVPLERLEAQICELAGHLTAATCRFLPWPPAPPAERGAAPRRPGTGHVPVPVPRLRVPAGRPAPHPVLEPRRPHRPGQPDQPLQIPPPAGPRARLSDRRETRRQLRLLPARWHRPAAQPASLETRGHDRGLPRRRDHRGHDHPAVVRRAARPGPRHLHLPGQRPQPAGAAGTGPGPRPRSRPGLRTRRLGRPDTPVLRPAHRRMTARARTRAAQPARQTGGAAPARLR